MINKHILFLAGAGGVGKTTTGDLLLSTVQATDPAVFVKSSTRTTYARLGIPTEAKSLELSAKDFIEFQSEIFADYCKNVRNAVSVSAKDTELIIIDRSPYDHLSYLFSKAPSLSLVDIVNRLDKADDLMLGLRKDFPDFKFTVCFFPYPRKWSNSVDVNDGQRLNKDAATYTWSNALLGMLTACLEGRVDDFFAVSFESETKEQTVEAILKELT